VGSGVNQGVAWVVFEIQGKRFSYMDSAEDQIELLDKNDKTLATYPVTNLYGPCRPGGEKADVYDFENGDRICLYWPKP
jgi:hypothetical protein